MSVPPCKPVQAMADDNANEAFVYTGEGRGADVPLDVVRVRIDPSVLVIQDMAFSDRKMLKEVELLTIREIGYGAFQCTAFNVVHLSDGVDRIGNFAFRYCYFTKFRSPPLVTTIPSSMLKECQGMFSLELPESVVRVSDHVISSCYSLRNVALESNTVVEKEAFQYCSDLLELFVTEEEIVNAIKIRFDGLPIHSKMYYKSYYNTMTLDDIRNLIIIGLNGERDPTGLQQDCLGMTLLHILACSTVQCLETYQIMVENYPENLIVEDSWGATPLLYAVWGDAPNEIVHFLVNSYHFLHPNHEYDWSKMVLTLGRANAFQDVIKKLLDVQRALSPGYIIDWDQVLGELVEPRPVCSSFAPYCCLIRCSIETRVNAIGLKHFRDAMADNWIGNGHVFNRQAWHDETLTKLEYYESEYRRLKEMTSLLEFALWKARMDDARTSLDHGKVIGEGNKKMKMKPSDFRLQCQISCGADHVIENVLPYLLPPDFVRSYVNDDDHDDYYY